MYPNWSFCSYLLSISVSASAFCPRNCLNQNPPPLQWFCIITQHNTSSLLVWLPLPACCASSVCSPLAGLSRLFTLKSWNASQVNTWLNEKKARQRCQEGCPALHAGLWINAVIWAFWKKKTKKNTELTFSHSNLQRCESPSMRIHGSVKTAFTVIEPLARVWTCCLP